MKAETSITHVIAPSGCAADFRSVATHKTAAHAHMAGRPNEVEYAWWSLGRFLLLLDGCTHTEKMTTRLKQGLST